MVRDLQPHRITAVFLDRDGVIIRDVNWLREVRQLRLLPRAAQAIRRLNQAGIPVILATNQSVIARGWLTLEGLDRIHAELSRRLAKAGAHLDAIYFCPHHPTEGQGELRVECSCRKPEPGMLLRAAEEMGFSLSEAIAIGDKLSDLEAGKKAGCVTALVLSGYGKEQYRLMKQMGREDAADFVFPTFYHAVEWILRIKNSPVKK